jgi:poly(glycerol-phosphate) alpha-glucosyltransferase
MHGVHTGGNVFDGESNKWYKNALEKLDEYEGMIVLTENQKKDIIARYTKAETKLTVIPHASFNQTLEEKVTRNRKKIVYVARFSPEKKHIPAIEIFKKVLEKVPDAELHFHGFGQIENDVRNKIKELKLENSIFITPYNKNVNKIYSEAGLSILTSEVEGFCMGVLESLSFGCPVVAFDIKYGPDAMIINNENGALIKPFNMDEFANSVVDILSNEEHHNKLINNCVNSVKHFSQESIAVKWKELLKLKN